MWSSQGSVAPLVLVFFSTSPSCLGQSPNSSSLPPPPPSNGSLVGVRGCGPGLRPMFRFLCDRRAVWGVVLETLASAGFLLSLLLLLGLLLWAACLCRAQRHQRSSVGGAVASMSLFLLATAGVFGLTFAFIIGPAPQTCPPRVFLFGVLFSLAFSCLLARCLALLGFAVARGWGEPALAGGLSLVQVVIATEWLVLVLVRDRQPCRYDQPEFVLLLVYVLCLLAACLALAAHFLRRSCCGYSAGGPVGGVQAALLFLTLLLSAIVWLLWITMLTRGNPDLGRRPRWDDPVLGVALVANGWVLLLGHGLAQVAFFCRGEARARDPPLSFAGWTSPSADIPGLSSPKEGRENGSYENEGSRPDQPLRSPYESGFSMTEIDTQKDYSIPRPKTTNYNQPYDEYYGAQ